MNLRSISVVNATLPPVVSGGTATSGPPVTSQASSWVSRLLQVFFYGRTNQRRGWSCPGRRRGSVGRLPSLLCKVLPRCVRSPLRSISLRLPAFSCVNAAPVYFGLGFFLTACPRITLHTGNRVKTSARVCETGVLWRPLEPDNKYLKQLQ